MCTRGTQRLCLYEKKGNHDEGKANTDRFGHGRGISFDGVGDRRCGDRNCTVTQTFNEPTCVVTPAVQSTTGTVTTATTPDGPAPAATTVSASSTSLPFTGADVEELAVLGLGAIVAGGVLMRRRRRMSA